MGLTALLVTTFTLAFAATLQAQVLSDPRIAEFDPSPDHSVMLDNGEPAVVRYELGVYLVGDSAPFETVDMGKPSPASDGKIRYDFSAQVPAWLLPGGNYEARVSAIGRDGAALSDPSNLFTFTTAPTPPTIPTVSWTTPTAITQGTPLGAAQLNASASAPGAFAYSPAAGTVLAAGTHTLTATFTPADATLYTTATAWTALVVTAPRTTPTLTWPTPASIVQGTALSATQLNATASVAGAFAYSPAAGTVLAAGTHTLSVTFTPTDTTRYTTATANRSLTVNPATYQLTISRPSGGMVNGAGISCGTTGTTCQVITSAGTSLGLQATPDAGYSFSGWTIDCSGVSPSYTIQLNGSKSCGATFTAVPTTGGPSVPPPDDNILPLGGPYTLTVARPSGGVVKSAGINCGTNAKSCTVTMPGAITIGLQAGADPGYVFLAWTGNCSGSSSSYALALEGPRTCGASFIPAGSTVFEPTPTAPGTGGTLPMGAPYTLTVARPTGGTIQASGIDCGTRGKQCSVTMPAALWLGLQATPDRGYTFMGWTGHCSGTQPGYSLALAGPRTCSATFTARQ